MGLFDFLGQIGQQLGGVSFVQHHEQVYTNAEHQGKLPDDVVAGAATYGAVKAFDKHVEEHGKPATHQQAKDLLSRLTTAEVDKIVKDKGLHSIDKAKTQKLALEHAEQALSKSGHY